MPFRKFFDRGAKPAPPEAAEGEELDGEEQVADEDEHHPDDDAEAPEAAADIDWRERAAALIPGGASTGSKRPDALYGSTTADAPTHFQRAMGCRVVDLDGNHYIDCTMALGTVALGYTEPNVSQAVVQAIASGHVSGLADVREAEVAERLCEVIPCAEQVRFLKTGAEAMSAAVRIARTYTGRATVIGSGYFGWHDWSTAHEGVPKGVRDDFINVPFDDIAALDAAAQKAGSGLAAIALEPVVERLPSPEWIARARAICDGAGAVLIFDEIKTGFRLRTGGYQEFAEVKPDLAAFGKAMSNGYALSAVVGSRALMECASRTWISSTLAGESLALAAAGAVLGWHEQADICDSLWSIGRDMQAGVSAAIEASGVEGITVDGIDPMWLLRFDLPARETRFLELAARHGVLFKRGAYNYAAMAHDDDVIREIEAAASATLVELREEERHR
jgi:glutamate-1-semialdehyde 2,1-aminomutase